MLPEVDKRRSSILSHEFKEAALTKQQKNSSADPLSLDEFHGFESNYQKLDQCAKDWRSLKALVEKRNSKIKEEEDFKVSNTPRRMSRISFSRSRTSITGTGNSSLGNGESIRKSQLLSGISRENLNEEDSPYSSTYNSRNSTQTENELNLNSLYNSDSDKLSIKIHKPNEKDNKEKDKLCDIMKTPISSNRQNKNLNNTNNSSSSTSSPKVSVRKNIYPIRRGGGLNPNLNGNAIMSLYGKDAFDYTKQKGSKHIDLEKLESPRSGTTSPIDYDLPINKQFLTENRNDCRFDGDANDLERITKTLDEKLPGIGYYSNDTPEPKDNGMYFIKSSASDYQTIALNNNGCLVITVYIGAKHMNKYNVKFKHIYSTYDTKYPNQVLLWRDKPKCYLTMVPIAKWKELNDIYYQWNVKKRREKEREGENNNNNNNNNNNKNSINNYNENSEDILYTSTLEVNSIVNNNNSEYNDILTNSLINDLENNYDKNPISSPITVNTQTLKSKTPINEPKSPKSPRSPRYIPQPPLYDRSKLEVTKEVRTPYSSFIAKSILSPRYTPVNKEKEREDLAYSSPTPPVGGKPKIYNPISTRTVKTFSPTHKNVK